MRQDKSRFDANGVLNITVPYNPNEPHSRGGDSGTSNPTQPFDLTKRRPPGAPSGQSGVLWPLRLNSPVRDFGEIFTGDVGPEFIATAEMGELAIAADRDAQWTLDNLHALVEKEVAAIRQGTQTERKQAIDNLINKTQSDIHANTRTSTNALGPAPLNQPIGELLSTFFKHRAWPKYEDKVKNFKDWDDAYRAAKSIDALKAKVNILTGKSNALAKAIEQTRANAEREPAQRAAHAAAEEAQRQRNLLAQTRQREANAKAAAEASRLGQRIADVLKTTALIKHLGPQVAAFAVGMGFPSSLGSSELPDSIATTPLSQLDLANGTDLRELADLHGHARVSHRLTFDTGSGPASQWVATNGNDVPDEVRVRHVLHNIQNNTYEFTRDGEDQPALIWTPITHPGNSSTHSPTTPPERSGIPGFPTNPALPELEIYPEADREFLDDYILIFPQDSGWEEQYVMFKSPRYLPGKVTGEGQPFPSNWQDLARSDKGVPISDKVAEVLAGRQYSEFRNLKRAIWRETAKIVTEEGMNLDEMTKGNAPFAPKSERRPGRTRIEIHHKMPISQGGEVYSIENLVLLTPKTHDELHREMKEKGAH